MNSLEGDVVIDPEDYSLLYEGVPEEWIPEMHEVLRRLDFTVTVEVKDLNQGSLFRVNLRHSGYPEYLHVELDISLLKDESAFMNQLWKQVQIAQSFKTTEYETGGLIVEIETVPFTLGRKETLLKRIKRKLGFGEQ